MKETPSSDISASAKATRDGNKGNEGNKRNPGPVHCSPDPGTENQELLSTTSLLEGDPGGKSSMRRIKLTLKLVLGIAAAGPPSNLDLDLIKRTSPSPIHNLLQTSVASLAYPKYSI